MIGTIYGEKYDSLNVFLSLSLKANVFLLICIMCLNNFSSSSDRNPIKFILRNFISSAVILIDSLNSEKLGDRASNVFKGS